MIRRNDYKWCNNLVAWAFLPPLSFFSVQIRSSSSLPAAILPTAGFSPLARPAGDSVGGSAGGKPDHVTARQRLAVRRLAAQHLAGQQSGASARHSPLQSEH